MKNNNINFVVDVNSFGKLLSIFRKQLGLNQKDFANLLDLSRVTVCKLEQLNDINEVSNDVLFRIYYFMYKISINNNITEEFKLNAITIMNLIDSSVEERISKNSNPALMLLLSK